MQKTSAGIVAWRMEGDITEVLLVHPGGPFFAKKDAGAWSIPKGEYDEPEAPLMAAQREFAEELGTTVSGDFISLGSTKLKSGKVVHAWAINAQVDVSAFKSNTFSMEWPPRSGKMQEFPEVDKAEWMAMDKARALLNPAQVIFLERLNELAAG